MKALRGLRCVIGVVPRLLAPSCLPRRYDARAFRVGFDQKVGNGVLRTYADDIAVIRIRTGMLPCRRQPVDRLDESINLASLPSNTAWQYLMLTHPPSFGSTNPDHQGAIYRISLEAFH